MRRTCSINTGKESERTMGSGLGLPIVRSIILAHGGRVWLDSAIGRGSTFFFSLQLSDAQN